MLRPSRESPLYRSPVLGSVRSKPDSIYSLRQIRLHRFKWQTPPKVKIADHACKHVFLSFAAPWYKSIATGSSAQLSTILVAPTSKGKWGTVQACSCCRSSQYTSYHYLPSHLNFAISRIISGHSQFGEMREFLAEILSSPRCVLILGSRLQRVGKLLSVHSGRHYS